MATNEAIIQAGNQALVAQAQALQTEMDSYLTLIQSVADEAVSVDNPTLVFFETIRALSEYQTALTADFASGLDYPDFTDLLAGAKLYGYDSDFLQYLEATLKGNNPPTWAATVKSIKDSFDTAINTAANTFLAGVLPAAGNIDTHAAAMQSQASDTASMQNVESGRIWAALAQDLILNYEQDAIARGIKIEDVRARAIDDMIAVHNDYNAAVLAMARTDFEALNQTVRQIRENITMEIQAHALNEQQKYEKTMLDNRTALLNYDVALAEIKDDIRRQQLDIGLRMSKAAAEVKYIADAITQSVMAASMSNVYTSESEG